MTDTIKKVCVIGAGVMGAGIAAQVANAGVPVLLLDIVRDPANRNAVAEGAVGGGPEGGGPRLPPLRAGGPR